jgi:hypothetical protein
VIGGWRSHRGTKTRNIPDDDALPEHGVRSNLAPTQANRRGSRPCDLSVVITGLEPVISRREILSLNHGKRSYRAMLGSGPGHDVERVNVNDDWYYIVIDLNTPSRRTNA